MEAAKLERTTIDITSEDQQILLRANGQVVIFDGFLKVYEEGRDDNDSKEDGKSLPKLFQNEQLEKLGVTKDQHFTQPPPRYTEATLVKKMEDLGIGRPSTYASIVTTIQEREYVRKEKNRLSPEDKGRIVKRTYVHTYVPTYLRTYVPTYPRTYVPTYLRTYVRTYLRTYVPTYLRTYVPTYLRTYVPTYLRTYVPTYLRNS